MTNEASAQMASESQDSEQSSSNESLCEKVMTVISIAMPSITCLIVFQV